MLTKLVRADMIKQPCLGRQVKSQSNLLGWSERSGLGEPLLSSRHRKVEKAQLHFKEWAAARSNEHKLKKVTE